MCQWLTKDRGLECRLAFASVCLFVPRSSTLGLDTVSKNFIIGLNQTVIYHGNRILQRSIHFPSRVCFIHNAPVHYTTSCPTCFLQEDIAQKIAEAKEVCDSGSTGECAAAWDEVEEISAEAAHAKLRAKESSDPLDAFCAENPETDECRVYED